MDLRNLDSFFEDDMFIITKTVVDWVVQDISFVVYFNDNIQQVIEDVRRLRGVRTNYITYMVCANNMRLWDRTLLARYSISVYDANDYKEPVIDVAFRRIAYFFQICESDMHLIKESIKDLDYAEIDCIG